jgi:hypothetical protein
MHVLLLFAQFDQFTPATNSKATVDAAELAKQLGPVWFFAVLCFVAFVCVVLGIGWILYKLGGKLMDRLDTFLEGIGSTTTTNSDILKAHAKSSIGAASNIANLCDAGHNFANAVNKIAKEMGADVSEDCEKIHDKLRTIVSA